MVNIFYSWQSDTPERANKTLLRQALDEAIELVGQELGLDEAERPLVDQDTQGVLGSPSIADTIFTKIQAADVVVADVTLTGVTADSENEKLLINSNVAMELGYAVGVHDDRVLLKVMNTHFGQPADLPFDLKHRRWPVQYNLAPDADRARLREVRHQLATHLAQIIGEYVRTNAPAPERYVPTASTQCAAVYWNDGEFLVEVDSVEEEERRRLTYPATIPLVFLRIWPDTPVPTLSANLLNNIQVTAIEPLCGTQNTGTSWERNRFGRITYAAAGVASRLLTSTQVFRNGEIWGVCSWLLRNREQVKEKFVPIAAFERGMMRSLHTYLKVANESLEYPDKVHVQAGLVNVQQFRIGMGRNFIEPFWGPIYGDVMVQDSILLTDPTTIDSMLLKTFEAVFDAAGAERPENLHNFPPQR